MRLESAKILRNEPIHGGYRLLELHVPQVAREVKAGQFVHLRVTERTDFLMRRPFSVFKADDENLSILYKAVGDGTKIMTGLCEGQLVSLIGPLGNGYPSADKQDLMPVLVAGGYGMAALYLVAERSKRRGVAFFGGASAQDILCVDEFTALGWDVHIATEDGTQGSQGLVTDSLNDWLRTNTGDTPPEFFVCGPLGMLRAVGDVAQQSDWKAWLSMDRHMGCGVGACLTCVQKVRDESGDWRWARICRDGPVFECRDIIWDDE